MKRQILLSFLVCATLFFGFLFSLSGCQSVCVGAGYADVIYHSGTIHTQDGPLLSGAIAVKGKYIMEVGGTVAVLANTQGPETRLINLKKNHVFPGMMDSLGCLVQLGTSLAQVDLLGADSWLEVVKRVEIRARRMPKGQWILGMGWDQNIWKNKSLPDHKKLSDAVPDHPVWLQRVGALCGIANQRAMDVSGVRGQTPDPRGGKIERDKSGRLTGIFRRTAVDLIAGSIHQPTAAEIKARLLLAQEACFQAGLTGLFVPGLEIEEIDLIKELIDEGDWVLPVSASIRSDGDPDVIADREPIFQYQGLLDVRCLTVYLDGALGSRGAALLEEYSDDRLNRGVLSYTEEEIEDLAQAAYKKGFQFSAHCIGDHAARVTINAIGKTFKERPHPDLRWRIEHSQIVESSDRKRYAELGIIPSMQPTHCPSDMEWALLRLGPGRRDRAYNWRAFADLGLKIAGGSDFPVESHDPLKGIYAAVTTKTVDGHPEMGYLPEVKLSRQEAIDLFTVNSANAVFQEKIRGELTKGKLAHMTIYDRDLLTIPAEEILKAHVLFTIINGRIVYRGR